MASDVAKALGAPEIAGTLVNPQGLLKKSVARVAGHEVAGMAGSLAAAAAVRDKPQGAPELPAFGRVGYVAVSETDVAVLKTKTGWKMKPTDEVVALASKSELTSIEWDEGRMVSDFKLQFANGHIWEFDIPRSDKKTGPVVAALESRTS